VYVHALTNIGAAEVQREDDRGFEKLDRALVLAQQHGLEDHAGRILNARQMMILRTRRLAAVERYIAEGLPYCEEHGLDTWRLYLTACQARVHLDRGSWEAASDSAALVLRDPHSAAVARNHALVVLGLVRARRGDAEAIAAIAHAHALADPTDELLRIGPVAAASAELAWLAGDREGAIRATDDALALAVDRRVPWAVGELAYWRWRAGARDELAAELLAEPYRRSIAGEWEGAAELWRTLGCPYEEALALADGDDPVALRRALEALQALGARPAAAIVTRRLRQRGVRGVPRGPRPTTRENAAGLTRRELEVVALVAEGLRNARIAERLVVSEKTVDHHVSAILRKLDAQTRGEAAAKAAQLGLLPPTQM
jgi:DNA-binding CsgD family transcriptional regulator